MAKHLILYSVMSLVLYTGCTDDLSEKEENNILRLQAVELADGNPTKSAVTSINEVNVYARQKAENNIYSDYYTGSDVGKATQTRFTNETGSWTSVIGISIDNGTAYLRACYPAPDGSTITSDNGVLKTPVSILQKIPFNDPADKQKDYLYSDEASAEINSRAISLTMHHALSQVSFRISKSSSVAESMTLKQIDIVSRGTRLQKGEGYMSLTDGTLMGLSATDSLRLTGEKSLQTTQQQADITCLVAPMSGVESSLSFSLTVNVGGEDRVFTTKSVTDVQWIQGEHYTYHITVNQMSGNLTDITIEKWKTDASPNTNIGI